MKTTLTKEQIALEYALRRVPVRGGNTPRNGFYWFKDVLNIELDEERLTNFKLTAYYHPNEPDFSAGCLINAQISSLFNKVAIGPKEKELGNIREAVVQIHSVTTEDYEYDGEPQKRYIVKWDIVDQRAFDNFQPAQITESNKTEMDLETGFEIDTEDIIDEELELILHETNEPDFGMAQEEIESLLDIWEAENELNNLNNK